MDTTKNHIDIETLQKLGAPQKLHPLFNNTVIIAALGYLFDIYDLVLFSIVRIESSKAWDTRVHN